MSVKLSPVAVLSTQLLSEGKEIDVRGPIHLTVPLPYHTHLRAADSLPAWAFDTTTGQYIHRGMFGAKTYGILKNLTCCLDLGTWVNKGIGSVRMERSGLVWTYVAPHLGNWIAAPSPISNGNERCYVFPGDAQRPNPILDTICLTCSQVHYITDKQI